MFCYAAKLAADMERAAEARHQRALAAKRHVRAKLEKDVRFRALYAAVAHTFADQLRQDLADLQAGKQVIPQPLSPASFEDPLPIHMALSPPVARALTLSNPAVYCP